jgi:predicted transcriptional regulator
MFEQEVELEKHQSSVVPLLLIVGLIVGIVGIAGYFVHENSRVLSMQEATALATNLLKQQSVPEVRFHTGMFKEGYTETTTDARYRMLAKVGVIKIGKTKGDVTPVTLTPKGEEMLKQISGVDKFKDKNDTDSYVVPLAERKLVAVSNITKIRAGRCLMEYTWQWQPNVLGEFFDVEGATVKSFSTWDRATLIDKHGANFFHQAPTKVAILTARDDKGWMPVTE